MDVKTVQGGSWPTLVVEPRIAPEAGAAAAGMPTAGDARGREAMNARTVISASAAPLAQRGIALVLVLWLTALLTVIAGGFAYAMRNEAQAARNTMSQAQARALADGAIARTVFELMRPRTIPGVWAADGLVHVWDEDGMRVAASAVDESGKIDLNAVPDALLNSLLQTAGQVDADTAARLVDVIGDWKDADDFRRANGAEAAEYQAAGLPYKPANAAFETVADLQRVLGMTPALFARLAGSLTVYSGSAGISPQFGVTHRADGAAGSDRRHCRHLSCTEGCGACRRSAAAWCCCSPAPARR